MNNTYWVSDEWSLMGLTAQQFVSDELIVQ